MTANTRYSLGLDYGTDSVRAILVDTAAGEVEATASSSYSRWAEGRYCEPASASFRQHPLDYLDCLCEVITDLWTEAPPGAAEKVAGLSIDTTGSTPVAVDKEGTALALKPEFAENPNAMFILWKDHTAVREAEEINKKCKSWGGEDFTRCLGGVYSSEWFWSKILHVLREDSRVRESAYSWIEHCDWLPAVLTGNLQPEKVKRSRCAAGHKAMWHPDWNGLPPEDFFTTVDPLLGGLRDRLYTYSYTSDQCAGNLTGEWAEKLGLPHGLPVGVGAFDAHMGAVGANIRPGTLLKVMGTSTCDMTVANYEDIEGKLIKGICGQVDGSILPGKIGLEAGQSAFGDLYAWYKDLLAWPMRNIFSTTEATENAEQKILSKLNDAAAALPPGTDQPVAVDWINGRRTPYADQTLNMAIAGINIGTDAPRLYRTLAEATAFGARAIMERFEDEGISISSILGSGGISQKSPFVMQVCADILNRPLEVVAAEECCALGAAMFASVVGNVHGDIETAQTVMNPGIMKTYNPRSETREIYDKLYAQYQELGQFVEKRNAISSA